MDGRATPTMEVSRASRNIAVQSTISVPQRRGVQLSPPVDESSDVVAVAVVMGRTLHARAFNANELDVVA
ncbi:hypothetical protein GCM10010505_53940 [Kitasatospora aburaviensis]